MYGLAHLKAIGSFQGRGSLLAARAALCLHMDIAKTREWPKQFQMNNTISHVLKYLRQ